MLCTTALYDEKLCMRTNEVCSYMSSEHFEPPLTISDVLYVMCVLINVR